MQTRENRQEKSKGLKGDDKRELGTRVAAKRTVSRTVRRTGVFVFVRTVFVEFFVWSPNTTNPKEVRVRRAQFLCVRRTFFCVFEYLNVCSVFASVSAVNNGKADQNWLPGVFAGCLWAVFVCFAHPLFVSPNNEQTPKSFVFIQTVSVRILNFIRCRMHPSQMARKIKTIRDLKSDAATEKPAKNCFRSLEINPIELVLSFPPSLHVAP